MIKKLTIIFAFIGSASFTQAQLADGSIAPDFTLTDINGNSQNLYTYLDAGKTVYLDIFAAHCPSCWAYHNSNALKDLYNNHGPIGTISQDIMVMAIEYDALNGTSELTGISGSTAGNWVAGTPYPIINPEGAPRTSFIAAYDVVFYPMIYAICPDKKITLIGTQNEATLYNHVAGCGLLGIDNTAEEKIKVFYNNEVLYVKGINAEEQITMNVYEVSGKLLLSQTLTSNALQLNGLESGVYIFSLMGNKGTNLNGKFLK
jgi:hypothetical protein